MANGSGLVHFTPIPEECATWITSNYVALCGPTVQTVTTGSRIPFGGHTYVELINNYQDTFNGTADVNVLIAYFRNDTISQKVYFYQGLVDSPYLTLDFSVPADGYVTNLTRVNVGGNQRTFWNENCYGSPVPVGYIEGVGPATGMATVPSCTVFDGAPVNEDITLCTTLMCFSVCGQTEYVYDSVAGCDGLLAITPQPAENISFKLFPNPTNEGINLVISEPLASSATFQIFNQLGQLVLVEPLSTGQAAAQFSVSNLVNDIYFWRLIARQQVLNTGKLAVVK